MPFKMVSLNVNCDRRVEQDGPTKRACVRSMTLVMGNQE